MLLPETRQFLEGIKAEYAAVAAEHKSTEVADQVARLSRVVDEVLSGTRDIGELNPVIEDASQKVQEILAKLQTAQGGLDKKGELTPENNKWVLDLLNEGYTEATMMTREFLDAAKGESAPDKPHVLAAMLKQLTNPQINFMRRLRKPTLYIVPDTTPDRLIAGLNKKVFKTMSAKDDLYNPYGTPQQDTWNGSSHYKNALAKTTESLGVPANQEKITRFHFIIAEGDTSEKGAEPADVDFAWNKAQEMTNEDRIAAFEASTANAGVSSMNSMGAIIAMAHSLRNKKPLNAKTFLLLPGEPKGEHVKDGYVAYCNWNPGGVRVDLDGDRLGNRNVDARVGASVMGIIN